METIRLATIDDLGRCIDLLGLLFGQEREFNPDPTTQRKGLEMILNNPRAGSIFVYERYSVIQGMAILLFTISTALGKRVAILEDMIVAPDARARGVGSKLLEHVLDFAVRDGLGRITLLTDHDNGAAHILYGKSGFDKSNMVVFRKLISI
jgi:GNAT superfamily N-acetyltransferase